MKKFENELYLKGYSNIAGLDEVGRGCWAGPLVVAICMFDKNYINNEIKDSKSISSSKREKVYQDIIKNATLVDWIIYDANYVDKHNPKQTTINGMKELITRHQDKIDYCLIDAEKLSLKKPSLSIVKGDQKSQSIAAASIVAKVVRDNFMIEISQQYPNYFFHEHKGYGTKKHKDALMKYGPIRGLHRFSYKPIKKL